MIFFKFAGKFFITGTTWYNLCADSIILKFTDYRIALMGSKKAVISPTQLTTACKQVQRYC